MLIEHLGKRPSVHPDAWIAPAATLCGDVSVAAGARILHGARLVAEGGSIEVGANVIVLENAVVRASARHSTRIGRDCLIGPNAHVVGCTLEREVFVATGAAVLHAAHLEAGCEVRVHAVVHLRSRLRAGTTVPIGWVAVGDPAQLFPPDRHDEIWVVQEPLDFPRAVYGVPRPPAGESGMPGICRRLSETYGGHAGDRVLEGDG